MHATGRFAFGFWKYATHASIEFDPQDGLARYRRQRPLRGPVVIELSLEEINVYPRVLLNSEPGIRSVTGLMLWNERLPEPLILITAKRSHEVSHFLDRLPPSLRHAYIERPPWPLWIYTNRGIPTWLLTVPRRN